MVTQARAFFVLFLSYYWIFIGLSSHLVTKKKGADLPIEINKCTICVQMRWLDTNKIPCFNSSLTVTDVQLIAVY